MIADVSIRVLVASRKERWKNSIKASEPIHVTFHPDSHVTYQISFARVCLIRSLRIRLLLNSHTAHLSCNSDSATQLNTPSSLQASIRFD